MSKSFVAARGYVTRLLVLVGCLSVLAAWYFTSPEVSSLANELQIWNINIGTFTLFVGVLTLSMRYYTNIKNRESRWQYKVYSLVLIAVWIIFGLNSGLYSNIYQVAYLNTKIMLHISSLGMLVFFLISGAYRVFRMRSIRAAWFASLATFIGLLLHPWVSTAFPVSDTILYWLLDNPAMAGVRALMISGAIGGVVLGIRVILGWEKSALRATE